jgi:hypothetical protein
MMTRNLRLVDGKNNGPVSVGVGGPDEASPLEARAAFAAELLKLSELFRQPMTEALAEIYADALKAFAITEIRYAVQVACQTSKFMPVPAELIETMKEARAEARRARAEAERSKALTAAPISEAERQDILKQIRDVKAQLTGKMRVPPAPRAVAELEAEVARLRAADRGDAETNARKAAERERLRVARLASGPLEQG